MDDTLPTPDLSRLPAEMQRPLAADVIYARRPACVAWGSWSFGLTWILMLVILVPFLAARLRQFPHFLLVELLPVAAVILVGLCLLIQAGLLHGWTLAWVAALNLCLLPVAWAVYWAVEFLSIRLSLREILAMIGLDLAAGTSALLTLILLFWPVSRRWFGRASVLRSQVRRRLLDPSTPR